MDVGGRGAKKGRKSDDTGCPILKAVPVAALLKGMDMPSPPLLSSSWSSAKTISVGLLDDVVVVVEGHNWQAARKEVKRAWFGFIAPCTNTRRRGMQSLRTRRPSDSRQPIKRSISKLAKSPSTRHNARKSTVDDKIKKRMSLKYAEISSPTDVSVPTVPSIPIGLRPGLARDQDEIVRDVAEVKEDPRLADQRLLDTQNFDPDACK
ncbi:hypothetical protein PISMIDRAFT_15218 [Pisolithus microcarpus 441]|uniref:Uncharacterized protein n=1 Tax=Pisolithus microcarpus 441 TaxID=765257 RepID=A0A0C9XXW4_9AGAM|nr:hypothetical protein PISMIDRAFT_15218 [Pisolithus microcarpus 441]